MNESGKNILVKADCWNKVVGSFQTLYEMTRDKTVSMFYLYLIACLQVRLLLDFFLGC